ncbi:hypothetical protein IW261DRAFT_1422890 [Armillaria novae-zelandiae]|uniref:Uncharacterized protein n=1 Tax=Armillaria novae-zelandiae TaxID=153914 RepID=A0AA39UDE8_9AGAR|nr:hypothetical protein IW261DRAFT_1422890 [Armillaria novae-zelandiae]
MTTSSSILRNECGREFDLASTLEPELLSAVTPSLAHLAATSLPAVLAVSNAVPASQLFPSSDLPPSSTPQLPYPLVASSSTVAARLGQMTALQNNPAALVAQMVSTQSQPQPPVPSFFPASCIVAAQTETSLIQAGLNPPPPFPLYSGPSIVEVQTHANSTSAWRAQHLRSCHAEFADNLAVGCNSRSGPSISRLKLLLFPVACGNNAHPPQHVDPSIHADDPHPWNFQILQEDIGPMDRQFKRIGLGINMIVHDGLLSFSDFHHAIAQHQALPDSPKIPGFNSDRDASYLTSGWCLQQMCLRCCEKAYKTGAYWCLQTLTAYASMVKAPVDSGGHSNPTLKHVFIIAPTYGNIVHGIQKCYADDFQTPIDPAKACLPHPCFLVRAIFGLAFLPRTLQNSYQVEEERCLWLCRGEDPNLVPSMSSQVHSITCPPHPTTNHSTVAPTAAPSSSSPSTSTSTVSSGDGATWSTQEENHNEGMVVDNDEAKKNQPPSMAQPSGINHELVAAGGILGWNYCPFSRLPNDSLLVSLRFPILDLTSDQAGFWWAVGFLLALFSTATGQACLPVQGTLIHILLLHALADPAMGELMLPWLDLGKTQAVTADPDGKDRLKEPVPQFLMGYCSDLLSPHAVGFGPRQAAVHENHNRAICAYLMLGNTVFDVLAAYHALHAGFHQPFGIQFGSLARGPTLPSMIKDACERKEKMALEFIYWWFNNRLEHVEQLIPHLEYDIGPIVNTPQNNLSFAHGEAETLAHRVSRAFQNSLEEYLRVNVKERGKQLLLAMTASPYLPANPHKKLKTIDIRYDGVLASLLANGSWRGIMVDSYLQGIFMGDVTSFNAE